MKLNSWVLWLLCIIIVGSFFYIGYCQKQLWDIEEVLANLKAEFNVQALELELVQKGLEEEQAQPNDVRYFESLDEFKDWLAEDKTDTRCYSEDFNCLDFALMLQSNALEDGYLISLESPPIANHWLNSVYIGDSIYLVEPQRDEVVFIKGLR